MHVAKQVEKLHVFVNVKVLQQSKSWMINQWGKSTIVMAFQKVVLLSRSWILLAKDEK